MALASGKLVIGLLGLEDPADVGSYSGTPFHLAHFLRAAGNDVRILGPYPVRYRMFVRLQNRLLRLFANRQLLWERHPLIADQYPAVIRKYVDQNPDLDLLLATSVFCAVKVRTDIPLLLWADSSVAGLVGTYPRYQRLSARTIAQSHALEQAALKACDMAIFSSQWAADVALTTYDLDPQKVLVINYGANLLQIPDEAGMKRLLTLRPPEPITVIAVGVDWQRKGMTKAVEVVGELRKRGMDAQLKIVGCPPPPGLHVPGYVSILGKISKSTPEGVRRLGQVLGESHLMILPTEAECAAVVLAEASAYGIPLISTDVGGNAALVQQNVNGILLAPQAGVSVWADAAMHILRDRETYERFVWQAYDFYRHHLSWENAVSTFRRSVIDLLGTSDLTRIEGVPVSSGFGDKGMGKCF
jgi:glycosyltransferase involved in cell wall biosynthesis